MKVIVRAFVVVLALTGAIASTKTSSASAQTIASSVQPTLFPVPTCPPGTNDPNPCNIKAGMK